SWRSPRGWRTGSAPSASAGERRLAEPTETFTCATLLWVASHASRNDHPQGGSQPMLNRIRNRFRNSGNGPWLFASVVVVAIAVSGSAFAFGEGRPILGGKRSPSSDSRKAFASETQIIANTST